MATLCCCGERQRPQKWMGMWTLVKIWYPGGEVYQYPSYDNYTVLQFFVNDSVTYICNVGFFKNGINITPGSRQSYQCIDKGDGNYMYFEDDAKYPFEFVDDTTLVIQRIGARYTMVRPRGVIKKYEDRILEILTDADYSSHELPHKSVSITFKEETLTRTSYILLCALVVLVLAISAIIVYIVRVRREGKRLAGQLRAIEEERRLRPESVSQAMKNVESDFLSSSYYKTILKRISVGDHLSVDDWAEMKRQLNSVYPNFTARLSGLVRMSEVELEVTMLVKMRVTPKEMANLLNLTPSSISTIRSRLYQKVFGKKGGSAEWDNFVMSL